MVTAYFFAELDAGLARACRELELPPAHLLDDEARSVAMKYALVARLAAAWGDVAALRQRVRLGAVRRGALRTEAMAYAAELLAAGRASVHPAYATFLDDYAVRLVELALDALLSERLGPEVVLSPRDHAPVSAPVYALCFSAFPHAAHEYYPLMVDALVAGAAVKVVAAHESWLHEGRLRRGVCYDADRNRLCEANFAAPAVVAGAQVLALNLADEADAHQRIERALAGARVRNPYTGARVLDNKAATGAIWREAGLPTPDFQAIPAGTPAEAWRAVTAAWMAGHTVRAVLKPADGTEGRGVELVNLATDDLPAGRTGAVLLLMEERGDVRYAGPEGPVRCALRVNVCWDGRQAWAESGFAQVADTPEGIASAGRGGRVMPLRAVWDHLCDAAGEPLTGCWARLTATAEAGAMALAHALGAAMPALVGLDLLLDVDADAVVPVLLEANPRPAGMSHARLFTPSGPGEEPGVSAHLWHSADCDAAASRAD